MGQRLHIDGVYIWRLQLEIFHSSISNQIIRDLTRPQQEIQEQEPEEQEQPATIEGVTTQPPQKPPSSSSECSWVASLLGVLCAHVYMQTRYFVWFVL